MGDCAPIEKKTSFVCRVSKPTKIYKFLLRNHECMEGIEAKKIEFQWI